MKGEEYVTPIEVGSLGFYTQHIFVCTNQKEEGKTCCANQGGVPYFAYLKEKLRALGKLGPGKLKISQSGCLGRCQSGPCLVIYPEGVWYTYQSFADLDQIIEKHLLNNTNVSHLVIVDG